MLASVTSVFIPKDAAKGRVAFLDLAMNEIGSQGIELMCSALAEAWQHVAWTAWSSAVVMQHP